MDGVGTLIGFAAGIAVVCVIAAAFRWFMRREPHLQIRRASVFDINRKDARLEAARAELSTSRSELISIRQALAITRKRHDDRIAPEDPPSTRLAFGLLGGILGLGEAGLFFLLSAPVQFLGLGMTAWAFASPLIAAGWILLLHVLIGAAIADRVRPLRTVRRAKLGAVIFGGFVAIGFWLTISGRNLTNVATIEETASLGLLVLAILLAVTSAFCTVVSSTLFEAIEEERELIRLDRISNLYVRHIELLENDILRIVPEPPRHSNMRESPVEQRVVGFAAGLARSLKTIIVGTALFTGILAEQSEAQVTGHFSFNRMSTSIQAQPVFAVQFVPFARARACEILIDVSGSVDAVSRRLALTRLGQQLPVIVEAFHCTLVRLTSFATEIVISMDEFELSAPNTNVVCSGDRATATGTSAAVAVLYPAIARHRNALAIQQCEQKKRAISSNLLAQRSEQARRVAEHLLIVGQTLFEGACTAIEMAVLRAQKRSETVIVLSDGLSTCETSSTRVIERSQRALNGRLIWLLIPARKDRTGSALSSDIERVESLEKDYPESSVLLMMEATPSLWHRVASENRSSGQ